MANVRLKVSIAIPSLPRTFRLDDSSTDVAAQLESIRHAHSGSLLTCRFEDVTHQNDMPVRPSCTAQLRNFDAFRREHSDERSHEALGQTALASHYTTSPPLSPARFPVRN